MDQSKFRLNLSREKSPDMREGRILRLLTVLMLCLASVACSKSPSESEMSDLVNQKIANDGGADYMSAMNLRKANARNADNGAYIADLEYDLVFKKGFFEIAEIMLEEAGGNRLAQMTAEMQLFALKSEHGEFEAGKTVPIKRTVKFVNGETGWMILTD